MPTKPGLNESDDFGFQIVYQSKIVNLKSKMVIGVCTLELNIPMAASLKDKRQVIKSVMARLRKEFNITVAEVDRHDSWGVAVLGVVTVSSDRDYAHGLLMRVTQWVENTRLDCELADYQIEFV